MGERFGNQVSTVLSEESQRQSGEDALSMNIQAGSAVADAVRTTLGPLGMDKMLVSPGEEVTVTNDGVTVLDEMEIDHPVAEMVVDIADTQEDQVGDGTTTAVVLAGALLEAAEDLIDRGVHPSTIVSGYRRAADEIDGLLDDVTVEVSPEDVESLERIAATAMTGKGAESARETLVPLVVQAVRRTIIGGEPDLDAIKVHPFRGGTISDSRLVEGMMVDREPDHPNMSTDLEDADLLVYDGDLERSEMEIDSEVEITDPDQLDEFVEQERQALAEMAQGVVEAGVDVLVTGGPVDERVQSELANAGVLSISDIREPDMEKLVRTTGASRVTDMAEVSESDLGFAGDVRQEVIRGIYGPKTAEAEKSVVFSEVEDAHAATLVLRGGTEHVVDEVERAIEDALEVVTLALDDGLVVPGGGAPETAVALGLREIADSVSDREQLAIEAVADAVESIPRALAENAGMDPIDALVDLHAGHEGGTPVGIDAHAGDVGDMHEAGVVEPRRVKTQAMDAGIEAVTSILRIDDVISAGDLSTAGDDDEGPGGPGGAPGGGMGGMGGMGGAM